MPKSDGRYIKTKKRWLYFTTINLYDKQVVVWSLSTQLHANQTAILAWIMATSKRTILENLIFHSDKGIRYARKTFRNILNFNAFISQSMSRKGNYWDNVVAESFFKSLKVEFVYDENFKTIAQAKNSFLNT